MPNATFDVVVSGMARGHHPRKVRQNLVRLLKTDASKIDLLLTGKSVAVLRRTDQATAAKYIAALENAGLSCELTPTVGCSMQGAESVQPGKGRSTGPQSVRHSEEPDSTMFLPTASADAAHGMPEVYGLDNTRPNSHGLATMSEVQSDRSCENDSPRRPYPVWIKLACAILILLVGFFFYRKARFYFAYSQGRKAVAAEEQGDHESAARLFASAAKQVPESQELAALAAVYEGLNLLSNQQLRKALPLFKKYDRYDSQNSRLKSLILTVESAIAFEDRDFDRFYELQKKSLAAAPQDPMKLAGVASALACKFAVSGDEAARNECLRYLEQAEKLAGPDRRRFEFYKQRILQRLDSREIISPEEFAHRYPRGYRKES
jgi:tetratricopeptide (TPR) repeat protein